MHGCLKADLVSNFCPNLNVNLHFHSSLKGLIFESRTYALFSKNLFWCAPENPQTRNRKSSCCPILFSLYFQRFIRIKLCVNFIFKTTWFMSLVLGTRLVLHWFSCDLYFLWLVSLFKNKYAYIYVKVIRVSLI